jgi:nucleoside-diphosphate-sugar epimerase
LGDVAGDIRFFEADIRDRERTATLFRGTDYVFHQAAQASVPRSIEDPWTCHDANVNGTLSVLLAARDAGVRRVVYAASSSAYGDAEMLPKVETMTAAPLSPYAVTKYVGELYCHVFHRVYGLETVALRYFNVFGPRQDPESQYAAVIPKFITALLRGQSPVIHGDGEQTRDFTYVEDVATANFRAALAPVESASGRVFNVGCGRRITVNDLVNELQQILETRVSPTYSTERTGDVRDSQADITAAGEALGYQPSADLREALRQTVAWFVAQERAASGARAREAAAA